VVGLSAAVGALNGAFAVMAAAFGAHGLESRLAVEAITLRQLDAFETGAEHHLYHAVALVLVGLAQGHVAASPGAGSVRAFTLASWLFFAGILLFSGSLYLYGLFGLTSVVWLTPIGGGANILGWLALAYGLFRVAGRH